MRSDRLREILATLDETGATDGIAVHARDARILREARFASKLARNAPATPLSGESGESLTRCCSTTSDAAVRRTRAVKRVVGCSGKKPGFVRLPSPSTPAIPDDAYSELEELVGRNVESKASTADEPIFRCQATDWFGASKAVGWWNVRSFLNEWSCGNVGFWRFSTTMTRIVLGEIGRRLHLIPRQTTCRTIRRPNRRDATAARARAGHVGSDPLQAGDRADTRRRRAEQGPVVRSFRDAPLLWQDLSVKSRVERFVDENTGKLVQLKSDCYILDGVVCSGRPELGQVVLPPRHLSMVARGVAPARRRRPRMTRGAHLWALGTRKSPR